jgi:hypothetical protein
MQDAWNAHEKPARQLTRQKSRFGSLEMTVMRTCEVVDLAVGLDRQHRYCNSDAPGG